MSGVLIQLNMGDELREKCLSVVSRSLRVGFNVRETSETPRELRFFSCFLISWQYFYHFRPIFCIQTSAITVCSLIYSSFSLVYNLFMNIFQYDAIQSNRHTTVTVLWLLWRTRFPVCRTNNGISSTSSSPEWPQRWFNTRHHTYKLHYCSDCHTTHHIIWKSISININQWGIELSAHSMWLFLTFMSWINILWLH